MITYLSLADLEGIFSFNSSGDAIIGFFEIFLNNVSDCSSLGIYREILFFSDKLLKFDIRLHLNTKAKVSLSLDKRKAIIILNDQGWLFNYEGQFNLSLEPSIFVCDNGRINETSQLILRGETLKENTEVLWGIKKDI